MTRQLSDPLTDDDKAWLRSWNRGDEIPEDTTGSPELAVDGSEDDGGSDTPDGTPEDESDQGEGSEDDGEEIPYAEMTVADLKRELKERGLPVGGKHGDLVDRLEADDES